MSKVSQFIKNHASVCVATFGLAIVGYLGYRVVRCIVKKCHRTEKVNNVAEDSLSSSSSDSSTEKTTKKFKPLPNQASDLHISEDKITMGQGEYIVFYQSEDGTKRELSKNTFDEVYEILQEYSLPALVEASDDAESLQERFTNRYEDIKAQVKKIDANLEVVFVPRTLYELFFIHKCIREDIKHKSICPFLDDRQGLYLYPEQYSLLSMSDKERDKWANDQVKRKCWHLCFFNDQGDDQHEGVKDVAYRLNQVAVKKLSPTPEGFTHKELSDHLEHEIDFLKGHYQEYSDSKVLKRWDAKRNQNDSTTFPGPTLAFTNLCRGGSLGIENDDQAQILRNVMLLECHKMTQNHVFVFRGANFDEDAPYSLDDDTIPYSLSYGRSVFAGLIYEGGMCQGATAFEYMLKGQGFAIPVPIEDLGNSPIYIPPTNTVTQLFARGEFFHARSMGWEGCVLKKMEGIQTAGNRDHLASTLTRDEYMDKFDRYMAHAIEVT